MQPFFRVDSLSNVKRFPFFITLSFIAINSLYSQTGSRWIFGDGVDIEFTDTDIIQRPSDFYSYECSSIYNINNNLYYSNGEILYLNADTILTLDGHNSASEGAYIDMLNDSTLSIYITETIPKDSIALFYYEISTASHQLLKKKIIALNAREQLGVVNHRNNYFTWIGSHFGNSDSMLFFLQGKEKLICPVIIKGGIDYGIYRLPQLLGINTEFSSTGNKLLNNPYGLVMDLYDFDNEYPKISNHSELNFGNFYSATLSPNGQLIYACHGNKLYQFDINQNFLRIIKSYDLPFDYWGELQLSPKGEILIANRGKDYLSAILYPDKIGLECSYKDTFINLSYGKSEQGLPNFNASYFYTPSIDFAYTEDCWNHDYSFDGRDTFDADGYKWIFEKVNSSELSVISGKNCVFTFPDTGTWEVSHIAWNTTRTDTVTKTLTIRPKWEEDVLGRDTFYCQGKQANITLQAPEDMHCIHWNGEEPNLDESLGPIVDYDHFHIDTLQIDTAGTYIVKLTNKTFCQMYDTIVVEEKTRPSMGVISRSGNELKSYIVATEYRWYLNGSLVQTTDTSIYDPSLNGEWQVQLVSEYGCDSELSDSLLVGFASIPSIKATNPLSFKVYPNPSDGNITIELSHTEYFGYAQHRLRRSVNGSYAITVSDLNGKLIYSTKQNLSLNFKLAFAFASGNYIVTLINENGETGSKQITVR
jgi:PKD repeat protein